MQSQSTGASTGAKRPGPGGPQEAQVPKRASRAKPIPRWTSLAQQRLVETTAAASCLTGCARPELSVTPGAARVHASSPSPFALGIHGFGQGPSILAATPNAGGSDTPSGRPDTPSTRFVTPSPPYQGLALAVASADMEERPGGLAFAMASADMEERQRVREIMSAASWNVGTVDAIHASHPLHKSHGRQGLVRSYEHRPLPRAATATESTSSMSNTGVAHLVRCGSL